MAVDASMRKLTIPPRFMPYLEKHRIYELFHDLGNQLAMNMPDDPLRYVKECLEGLSSRTRDRRLVVLMTPPYLNRAKLAQMISVKTGCDILSRYVMCLKSGNHLDPEALAVNTADLIKTSDKEGWILADYPETVEEAKIFIKHGLLPTHAFLFLENDEDSEGSESKNLHSVDTSPSILLESESSIFRLRELFKSSLKIVKMKNRSLEELANACVRTTIKMPIRNAPKLFRVALIGPRGSRRRTIARLLQKQYHLVHVDIESLISSARNLENDVGDEFRRFDKRKTPYTNNLIFSLLKARLYQKDCLDRGYVLTNYPCCLEDFVLLDSIDTPPNRVIFFDMEDHKCQERLYDRVVNKYTGGLYSRKEIEVNELMKSQTLTHPNDEPCKVDEEIKFYNKHVQSMMDYCGKTCSIIDTRGSTKDVLERVECVLMGPSPAAKPRSAKLPPCDSIQKILSKSRLSVRTLFTQSYPVSITKVLPLIDSEELLERYKELKRSGRGENVQFIADSSLCLSCRQIFKEFKSKRDSSLCISCQQLLKEFVVRSDSSLCSSCQRLLKGTSVEKSYFLCLNCKKFLGDFMDHSNKALCETCQILLKDTRKLEALSGKSFHTMRPDKSHVSFAQPICSACRISLESVLENENLVKKISHPEFSQQSQNLASRSSLCESCRRILEWGTDVEEFGNQIKSSHTMELARESSLCSSCKLLLKEQN